MSKSQLERSGFSAPAVMTALLLLLVIGCGKFLPPPIPPQPEPQPQPTPIVSTARVIVIEETADRTPEAAAVLGDLKFWQSLPGGFRFYDDDSPDAIAFVQQSADISRPTLILIDQRGKVLLSVPLPKTTAEIKALLK